MYLLRSEKNVLLTILESQHILVTKITVTDDATVYHSTQTQTYLMRRVLEADDCRSLEQSSLLQLVVVVVPWFWAT